MKISQLSRAASPSPLGRQDCNLWPMLIICEVLLGSAILVTPQVTVPLFFLSLLILAIFLWPEWAYYLVLVNINYLIFLEIKYPFVLPPRLFRCPPIPFDVFFIPQLISYILLIFLAASWVLARLAGLRNPYPGTDLDVPIMMLLLWCLLSLFWTAEFTTGVLEFLMNIMVAWIFYATVALVRNKEIFNRTVSILLGLGIVYALVTVYSIHGQPIAKELYRFNNIIIYFDFIGTARERGAGLASPNYTACLLNICIMFAGAKFFVTSGKTKKVLLALIILLLIFASLATFSKSGFLALLAGAIFFGLTSRPVRKYFLPFLVGLVILFFALNFFIVVSWPWPEQGELMRERLSLFPRQVLWTNGFQDLISNYGLGYGIGTMYPAHSLYFYILFETGIPGFFILLWIFTKWFLTTNHALKISTDFYHRQMLLGCLAAMISIMVEGLVDFLHLEMLVWIIFGLGMALVNLMTRGNFQVEAAH